MTGMNEQVRGAVKTALEQKDMTQAELARRLGMERANVNRLLQGTSGKVPDVWQKVLDELGLQLIAVPKDSEEQVIS